MARTLDQIYADLGNNYTGSANIINTRLNAIPGEIDAGIAATDAKLNVANENILNSARRRGTGIALGGIPVGEQAKYAATDYAPAIANLRATGAQKELSLQESLQQLDRERRSQSQSIYDNELSRDFQERQFQEGVRQFNEQQAAAARAAAVGSGGYSFGGGEVSTRPSLDDYQGEPSVKVNGSSYAFYDQNGKGIGAIQYAAQTGYGVRKLLSEMASKGDKNAAIALKYVGNDGKFGAAPESVRSALQAVGATGNYTKAAASKPTPITKQANTLSAIGGAVNFPGMR